VVYIPENYRPLVAKGIFQKFNSSRGQALEEFRMVCWARVRGAGGPEVGFRELVFIYCYQ